VWRRKVKGQLANPGSHGQWTVCVYVCMWCILLGKVLYVESLPVVKQRQMENGYATLEVEVLKFGSCTGWPNKNRTFFIGLPCFDVISAFKTVWHKPIPGQGCRKIKVSIILNILNKFTYINLWRSFLFIATCCYFVFQYWLTLVNVENSLLNSHYVLMFFGCCHLADIKCRRNFFLL